jgi:acyl carrier protein
VLDMDRDSRPIRTFIVERLAPATGRTHLDDDDDLIDSGVVDSLGIFQLVAFLEEKFGVVIADSEITPDNFATIARIERLVAERGR